MNESQLVRTIKAHIERGDKAKDKAEQHYIAAGQHLKELKGQHSGSWAEWEELLKDKIGIGKSRASELMQIADGTKTVEGVAADRRERQRKAAAITKAKLSVDDGENNVTTAGALVPAEKEASAEKDGDHLGFFRDGEPISWEEATLGPEGAAALRAVASIPEANREDFFDELYDRYPDDCGHPIYAENDDLTVVRTLIEAIGVDRARALGENMPRLTFKAVGRAALPDCEWCKGSGLKECEVVGGGVGSKVKMQCDCTKRRRWEDFKGLKARLEREKAEHDAKQGIPQQDFSFGLEVTTKDGRVWASGVRLPNEEEAKFYFDYWVRNELRKHAYKTWENEADCDLVRFEIKRYDEQPLMRIWGGKRKSMTFMHGTCHLLDAKSWRPISGAPCDCKFCERIEKKREKHKRWVEAFHKECEIAEQALAAGKISQEQYDAWENGPVCNSPEWLKRVMAEAKKGEAGAVSADNDVDAEASAEAMRAKFAEIDDGLDIPQCLRRNAQ